MLHLYAAGHWQPVTLPRAIPWAWFRRQLQLQQRKLALGPLLQSAWNSALDQYAHDNLVAVALTSGAALWEEATAMRHCAGNTDYVQECVLGFVRIFSVRDRITGKRRATVNLQRHFGGWRAAQTTGFANRKADDSVIDFTRRLLVAFKAADAQTSTAASDRVTEPEPEPALERKQEPDQEAPIICRRRSAIGPPAPS